MSEEDKKAEEGAKKKKKKKATPSKKLKEEIKKMEAEKRAEAMKAAEPAKKVSAKMSFDSWYATRAKDIPATHRKEVLRADFKGRGLKGDATMEEFDAALEKYGIKLKK